MAAEMGVLCLLSWGENWMMEGVVKAAGTCYGNVLFLFLY